MEKDPRQGIPHEETAVKGRGSSGFESHLRRHRCAGTLLSRIPEQDIAGMSPVESSRRAPFFREKGPTGEFMALGFQNCLSSTKCACSPCTSTGNRKTLKNSSVFREMYRDPCWSISLSSFPGENKLEGSTDEKRIREEFNLMRLRDCQVDILSTFGRCLGE